MFVYSQVMQNYFIMLKIYTYPRNKYLFLKKIYKTDTKEMCSNRVVLYCLALFLKIICVYFILLGKFSGN